LNDENDPNGFKKAEHLELLKMNLKKKRELEETKVKVYSYIKLHLTQESWEEVKASEGWEVDTYNAAGVVTLTETVERLGDPYFLIQAIKESHSGHRTGVSSLDNEDATTGYANVRQKPDETLYKYLEFFNHKVNTPSALGLYVPDEQQQAVKFIKGLDSARYSELKDTFYESAKANLGDYPETVMKAYHVANNHRQKYSKKRSTQGVAYNAKVTTKENTDRNPKKPKFSKEPKKPFCYVCKDHDHWTQECPLVAEAQELGEKKSAVVNLTVKRKSYLTVTVLHSTYRPDEIGRNELALDSAATACLARERAILTNLRTCNHTAEITGVSGEVLTTNVIGDLKDGLGEAYYHPKAVANIIPFGRVESTFDMKWVRNIKFHFTNQDGKEISFNKRSTDSVGNGLYIYDMTPVATQRKSKAVAKELVAITTVDENKSHYTKREIKQAEEAKGFMKKTGYPSVADAIKIIESGAIMDCPITPADILRARDIWGPDLASLKGKTVHKKLKRVREDFLPKPKESTAVQNMYADICFLDDKPYMLSITQPLNMIMLKDLNGKRDAATISDAIVGMVLQYRSRGFRIDKLFSDSERGMEASRQIFHAEGIDLDLSSAGEHVPIIERNVRFIKERIRTILSGLPYRLPNKFMPYLADHAVMMINSFPRPSSHDPISHFTGRKLNYKRDFRVSFGEYAQIIIPNATLNDVRQPRTEGAIALLNTGNANSSVYFYVLRSGQVVARDRFTVLPMTLDVITRLENMVGRDTKGSDDIEMNRKDDITFEEDEDEDSVRVYVPREVQDLH
jgi:hypothetical protein